MIEQYARGIAIEMAYDAIDQVNLHSTVYDWIVGDPKMQDLIEDEFQVIIDKIRVNLEDLRVSLY